MKQPRDSYPQAIVPEHLKGLTIDTLPLDVPFYISPGERGDYNPAPVFVDHKGRLRMSRSSTIDPSDAIPGSGIPFGLVGVMRSTQIDPGTNTVRVVYLADLRMIDAHSLVGSDDAVTMASDQEEYMHYLNHLEHSIVFDGFIAADGDEMEDEDVPRGAFYGTESIHPQLKALGRRSKHLMKVAMRGMVVEGGAKSTDVDEGKKKKMPKE